MSLNPLKPTQILELSSPLLTRRRIPYSLSTWSHQLLSQDNQADHPQPRQPLAVLPHNLC